MGTFRSGGIRFLVNVAVAVEGFDLPEIRNIAVIRPTFSLALYTQMLGRGFRPLPGVVDGTATAVERWAAIQASAKPYVCIWDFVGASRHKLRTAADLFLKGDKERDVAATIAAKAPAPVDLASILQRARRSAEMYRMLEMRGYELERVKWKTKETSVFNLFDIPPELDVKAILCDLPTPGQLAALKRAGIEPRGLSRGEAVRILNKLKERRDNGLCSFKQAKILASRGFPVDLTREEAGRVITDLVAHGWTYTRYRPWHFRENVSLIRRK